MTAEAETETLLCGRCGDKFEGVYDEDSSVPPLSPCCDCPGIPEDAIVLATVWSDPKCPKPPTKH